MAWSENSLSPLCLSLSGMGQGFLGFVWGSAREGSATVFPVGGSAGTRAGLRLSHEPGCFSRMAAPPAATYRETTTLAPNSRYDPMRCPEVLFTHLGSIHIMLAQDRRSLVRMTGVCIARKTCLLSPSVSILPHSQRSKGTSLPVSWSAVN